MRCPVRKNMKEQHEKRHLSPQCMEAVKNNNNRDPPGVYTMKDEGFY